MESLKCWLGSVVLLSQDRTDTERVVLPWVGPVLIRRCSWRCSPEYLPGEALRSPWGMGKVPSARGCDSVTPQVPWAAGPGEHWGSWNSPCPSVFLLFGSPCSQWQGSVSPVLYPGFNCCPETTAMSRLMQKGILSYSRLGKTVNGLVPGKWWIFTCLCRYLNLNAALLEAVEADGTHWALTYMRGKLWLDVTNLNISTVLQSQLAAFPQWGTCTTNHNITVIIKPLLCLLSLSCLLSWSVLVAEVKYAWLSLNNAGQGMSWIL